MLQLLVEGPHKIVREYLEAGQSPQSTTDISIEKTPEVFERLRSAYDCSSPQSYTSPSALNAYLDCRLKFYYRYVAKLKSTGRSQCGNRLRIVWNDLPSLRPISLHRPDR